MTQQEKYDNDTHHDHGNKHMKHTTSTKLNGRHLEHRSRGITSAPSETPSEKLSSSRIQYGMAGGRHFAHHGAASA